MCAARALTVVSTNWLKGKLGSQPLKRAPRDLRVLDVSFSLDRQVDTYKEGYMQGHIPTSVHFDIFKCVTSTPEILCNLPDTNCFTDYIQSLGVWPDTHVVAYDRWGPISAYRAWWMLRLFGHKKISVLDGGFRKWTKDGHDVTTEVPNVERSDFVAKLNKNYLRTFDDVITNLKSHREQMVDSRVVNHPSIIDEKDGGTIPGVKHVGFDDLWAPDGTLKSTEDLQAMFDKAGVDLAKPMFVTCLRGMTACAVVASSHILGKEDVPIYYGSWMEYRRRAPEHLKCRPEKKKE